MKSYKNRGKGFNHVLLILLMLFIFSWGVNGVAAANTTNIYVNIHGNDTWDGQSAIYNATSKSGPKATINDALSTISPDGTIIISSGTYNEHGIIIDKNVKIDGAGQNYTVINAQGKGGTFIIETGITVSISNLSLINGENPTYNGGKGGSITNYGTLTINNSKIDKNTAVYVAGAIYNWGAMTISNSTLDNNAATKTNLGGGHGGAILNDGTLTMTDDILDNNFAYDNGGAVYNDGALNIFNSTFNNNTAVLWGGGAICNYGNFSMNYSNVTNNKANYGGAIQNYNTASIKFNQITGNKASMDSAIYDDGGTLNASDNWWGSNNNPTGEVSGNVIIKSWLTTPLTVYNIDPSNNSVNVPTNKTFTVIFSEPIKIGNTTNELESNNGTIIPLIETVNNNILSIEPTTALNNDTEYTLILKTGSLIDSDGNQLLYYNSSFTTGPTPIIIKTNPLNGAINVPDDESINVTFSEKIEQGDMNIAFETLNGTAVPFTTAITDNILTITPESLLNNDTNYSLILHTGSITDLTSQPNSPTQINFSTGPLPKLISIEHVNKQIIITFNEPIKAGNMLTELENSNGIKLGYTTTINGNILTLTPNTTFHYIYYINPTDTPKYNLNTMKKDGITDVFMLVSSNPKDFNYYATYLPKIKPQFEAAGITLYAWIFPDFTTQDVAKIAAMGVNINLDLEFGYLPSTDYVTNYVANIRKACEGRIFTVAAKADAPDVESGAVYGDQYGLLSKYVDAIVPMLYKWDYSCTNAMLTSASAYEQNEAPNKIWIALQSYNSETNPVTLSTADLASDINSVLANSNGLVSFRYGLSNFGSAITTIKTDTNKYTLTLNSESITDLAGNPIVSTSINIALVTISPNIKSGYYNTSELISLKMNRPGTIYYTLDGTNPTESSAVYTTPIMIIKTTVMKCFAVDSSGNTSPINSYDYFLDKTPPMIISTTPTNNFIGESVTSPIVIKFSEFIVPGVNYSKIYVKNLNTGKVVPITKTISLHLLTIEQSGNRTTKDVYEVCIPAMAIKDYYGNNQPNEYIFKFQTI